MSVRAYNTSLREVLKTNPVTNPPPPICTLRHEYLPDPVDAAGVDGAADEVVGAEGFGAVTIAGGLRSAGFSAFASFQR